MARGTWRETDEGLVLSYDPNLMKTLEALDLEAPLPDLWPLFEDLKTVPVLVIRGANSDLLSDETLRLMGERHPRSDGHHGARPGTRPFPRWRSRSGYPQISSPGLKTGT